MRKGTLAFVMLAALISLGILVGCSGSKAPLSASIPEGTITCEKNQVTIELESNPTTGYQWTFQVSDGIENTGDSFEEADSDLVGAPGTQIFTFETTGEGESTVTLTYARSWESTPDDIVREITFTTEKGSIGAINSPDLIQ